MRRPFFVYILSAAVIASGLFLFQYQPLVPQESAPRANVSAVENASPLASSTSATVDAATSSPKAPAATSTPIKKRPAPTTSPSPESASSSTSDEAVRIQNPYTTPPETFDEINATTRSALVNILCEPRAGGSLRPISGSGVLIDPRGVILTNAHLAQYVLLSESPDVDLECFVRTGSPAVAQFIPSVLFIPPVWVETHASEILDPHPMGTGEHDYALLYITNTTDGSPLPGVFPFLPLDVREAIGFPGDTILAASYPAEFLGGVAAQYALYSDSSVTTIKQLLTFDTGSADILSLGGIIEAQSGSSGGAVVNAWGRLVGIITTTSSGSTTASRDLRALSLSYINADIKAQSGSDLPTILAGNPLQETQSFTTTAAPSIVQRYINFLSR